MKLDVTVRAAILGVRTSSCFAKPRWYRILHINYIFMYVQRNADLRVQIARYRERDFGGKNLNQCVCKQLCE